MIEALASETRWRIIELLGKGDKTPTDLSKLLKKSLPNIYLHLNKLEKLSVIKRVGDESGKTRPYTKYSLGNGFIFFIEALPGDTKKLFLEVDENLKVHLNLWSIPQREFHYYIERVWWDLQDYLSQIDAVAVFGSVARGDARPGSDIDMIILTKKYMKKFEKFNARIIGPEGKGKMVMAQAFSSSEFRRMFESGSDFAKEVIASAKIIHDPGGVLEGFRK